ncbi:AAA family ATPase [Frankia sp. CNm7]|uniref:AAA family ATPase n=1 Tax=Frankia nepalensis TaxID=1836974 RepID=A0A937RE43_9ACTN|nr:LuxR family transcriptional regulator [Frankia nepalensis]MBL7502794.1 AAA family ATPase [Frankia nepalensis]MBL7512718.1 AAA family ATPase [Frankia nepalensis]MBL7524419.1 AAA family ATPase [Frankia nepalensis]MBL7628287.1 AAA family ATPase [Frankia nepalensis]
MLLVERAEELLLLKRSLDEAEGGAGQVVSISGSVGSGKTELTRRLADWAADRGVRVVQTYAAPAGRGASPGIFGQLLEACTSAAELRRAVTATPAADLLPPQLMLLVCHDLLRSAAQTPLLLIVDDVHQSDPESLRGLLYLVRHCRTAPVMLVLITGECLQQSLPLFQAELSREPNYWQIQLPLLSVAGVAGVLAERLDDATAHRLAPAAHAASGGNPLVVRALLAEHLHDHPADVRRPLAPGDASATAVLACLHRIGQAGLEVARAIALLGEHAAPELISRLISRPRNLVERASAKLSAAGLLGPDGLLCHPGARSVVLSDPNFDDAAELRYGAAELLHAEGEAPLRVAEHLIAADRIGRSCYVPVLRQAAEDALADGRADVALQCLDLALRECPDGEQRALITAARVRVEWRMNPARAMSHFAGLLDAFEHGCLPDLEAVMLGRALMWHGREEEAARILDAIRSRTHAPEVGEALLSTDQSLRSTHPGSAAVPREGATARPSDRDPAAGPLPDAAMWHHLRAGDHAAAARFAEDVLRDEKSPDYWRGPHCNALHVLIYVHELDRAEYWATRIYRDAKSHGYRTWQALRSAVLAEIARRRGDLPAAERLARGALQLMGPRAWGPQIDLPLSTLIYVLTAMGRHGAVTEWLAYPRPAGAPTTRYGLHYLDARAQHQLAIGRHLQALQEFLACGQLMASWDMDIVGIAPWRLGVAEALLQLGRTERAARTLDELGEQPGATHPLVRGGLLRLRAAIVKPRQAVVLLRECADLLESSGSPAELLAALIDLHRAHVELGDSHRAHFTARQIWRAATQCGAEARVRRILGPEFAAPCPDHPTPPAAPDTTYAVLSDAELRVAALAARGHTNREIASRLYITVSTVEQHLTRVYRKLQVGGRIDLQTRLNPKVLGTA